MNAEDAARRSVYLLYAARAGKATKQQWQDWADRLIEAHMVDDWVIDISLARDVEQLSHGHAAPGQPEVSPDAILGHLWTRYQDRELSLNEFLERAAEEADRYPTSLDNAFFNEFANRLESGAPLALLAAELKSALEPMRLEAERHLRELFAGL